MTRHKLLTSISRLVWDSDMLATRFILSIAEFLWAIMLLWPGDTFMRPTYTGMSAVFNEQAWSAVFLISAATQLSIILMDDFHSKFARYFAAWNGILWFFVVSSMLLSVYPPPAAIAGEMALAAGALWIWLRPYILAEGLYSAGIR
jgi:hypothetical protein